MKFYPTLEETLANRFGGEYGDADVIDIVNHGIDSGFGGFIYHFEINEFFNEFESEIEEVIDNCGLTLTEFLDGCETFQEQRCRAVWFAAEEFCHRKFDLMYEAELAAV